MQRPQAGALPEIRDNQYMRFGPLLLLAATVAGYAQFPQTGPGVGQYPPGQYPPGQYPPGKNPGGGGSLPGLPGRNRGSKTNTSVPTDTVSGMLRRGNATEVAIEAPDKRIIRVVVNKTTKYVTTDNTGKSNEIQSASLEP